MQPCYLIPQGHDAETVKLPAYITCDSMTGLYVTACEDTQQAGAMLFMCPSCMHAHFHSCINAGDR